MDTQRLILFFIFAFSLLMLWEAWQKEMRPPQQNAAAQQALPSPSAPAAAPVKPAGAPPPPAAQSAAPPAVPPAVPPAARRERIRIKTDLLHAEIDTQGGDIVYLELLKHKDSNADNQNLVLLSPEHRYAAQSGLIGEGLPNHKTVYSSASPKEVTLAPGKDSVSVRLEAPESQGVKVAKILTFHRGGYEIEIAQEIANGGAAVLAAHAYFQLTRDNRAPPGEVAMMPTFTVPAVYTAEDKYQKLSWEDLDKGKARYPKSPDNGWIAIVQHYFVAALLPAQKTPREFYTRKLAENFYSVGVILPVAPAAPGATTTVQVSLYAGPQEQEKLKSIAAGLDLVVDYGWLTVIAAPLFWVLELFHKSTGNWGIAIILLTVVIKLIFFPLSAASYRSMAKMKLVTPRLMKIRETYANDRAKQNQAMMDLYKAEKINPLGGCLPIVVQIPVFIALYWVLLAAVELRHAPFYLWITDLSAQDPWYVLPALMMVSMLVQTKMNPTPPDPVQAKVMMIMPFAFGIMFFFFPSGLVLYWFVNNILSIAQQWQINRMIEGGKAAAKR